VNTLPLSVSTASGIPYRRMAEAKAWQTAVAVALGTAWAATQNREWSSRPVTTLNPRPSARRAPMTSICHSSMGLARSHRLQSVFFLRRRRGSMRPFRTRAR
jgi:hypothetical protein